MHQCLAFAGLQRHQVVCQGTGLCERLLESSLQAARGGAEPSVIRDAVLDLWRRLDEQLHRIEAALPSGKAMQRWAFCRAGNAALRVLGRSPVHLHADPS